MNHMAEKNSADAQEQKQQDDLEAKRKQAGLLKVDEEAVFAAKTIQRKFRLFKKRKLRKRILDLERAKGCIDCKSHEQTIADLKKQLQEALASAGLRSEQNLVLEKQVVGQMKQLGDVQTQLDTLKQTHAKEQRDAQEQYTALQSAAEQKHTALTQQVEALHTSTAADKSSAAVRVTQLEAEMTAAQSQQAQLAVELKDATQKLHHAEPFEEKFNVVHAHSEKLADELKASEAGRASLQSQAQAVREELRLLKPYKEQYDTARRSNEQLTSTVAQQKVELRELMETKERLADALQKITLLEGKIGSAQSSNKQHSAQLAELRKWKAAAERTLDEQKTELTHLRLEQEGHKEQVDLLEHAQMDIEISNEELNTQLQDRQQAVRKLTMELSEAQDSASSLSRAREAASDALRKTRNDVAVEKEMTKRLNEELQLSQSRLMDAHVQNTNLADAKERLDARYDALQDEHSTATDLNMRLTMENARLTARVHTLEAELAREQQSVQTLEANDDGRAIICAYCEAVKVGRVRRSAGEPVATAHATMHEISW
jgi:chromosome segregation ATPase